MFGTKAGPEPGCAEASCSGLNDKQVRWRFEGEDAGRKVRVHGTQYLLENLNAEDQLLIVDDVFSSGRSARAVIDLLAERTKRNMPHQVKVATPWYCPKGENPARPDYFLYETDDWLVFPYELNGLTREEIARHKPFVAQLLDEDVDTTGSSAPQA